MIIPDKILIQLTDTNGNPFRQENVLTGIRTFATYKNDIDLYPFLSNEEGKIEITEKEIKDTAGNFISFGLMDYGSLESARPDIHIYLWTSERLDYYVNHWGAILYKDIMDNAILDMLPSHQRDEFIEEMKKTKAEELVRFEKFKICYNKQLITAFTPDIHDKWDGRQAAYSYEMRIKVKNA